MRTAHRGSRLALAAALALVFLAGRVLALQPDAAVGQGDKQEKARSRQRDKDAQQGLRPSDFGTREPRRWDEKGQGRQLRAQDREIRAALREVINRGADLFNLQGDHAGCARLYEGALIAVRPLLKDHSNLQRDILQGVAAADNSPNFTARAFALRKLLDQVRSELGPPAGKGEKRRPEMKGEKKTGPEDRGQEKRRQTEQTTTLWHRLGGEANVKKVVDDFVKAAAADPQVDFTRGGKYPVDMPKLKKDLVDLISQVTGGPRQYTGKDMREVHRGMHITNRQFNRAAELLRKALEDHDARPADIDDLLAIVETTRKQIVQPAGKKKGEKGPTGTKGEENKRGKAEKEPPEKEAAPDREAAARVSGHVTYKGKPVSGGTITLTGPAERGKTYRTALAGDGTYVLKDLPAGEYTIAVDTESLKRAGKPAVRAKAVPAKEDGGRASYVPIPARYADPARSGLRVTVRAGLNEHDIALQD